MERFGRLTACRQSCGAACAVRRRTFASAAHRLSAVNKLQNHPMFAVVPMTVSQRSPFAQLVTDRVRLGSPAG